MRGEGGTAPAKARGLRSLRSGLLPLVTLSLVVAAGCQRVGVHTPEPVAPRPGMTAVPVVHPGETAAETLARELHEELGVRLDPNVLEPLGTFTTDAANEAGIAMVFTGMRHFKH